MARRSRADGPKVVVRTLAELGVDLSFAPERHLALAWGGSAGVDLGQLVVMRRETVSVAEAAKALVLDTTHAKDGLIDLPAAERASSPPRSAKTMARAGDLLVSRLRPYLRQVAYVHPAALRERKLSSIACSTEYYVLAPRPGERIEYLLPFLLGRRAQAVLAAGQEGGHHPRVPLETLLALRVPDEVVGGRARTSARVDRALAAAYRALASVQLALGG